MELELDNPEFKIAFELVRDTNRTFFLTGKAGTGKSTFLRYIVDNIDKNFVVVAPTGIAAVNVNGVTLFSFFQFPLRPLLPEDRGVKIFWKDSEKRKIISRMDTLIIDEVSMVRADMIDGIDYSLRKNGGNPNLPFGGKQVVFIGDIFQLEPVAKKKSGEFAIINDIYGSLYFYNAKVFERIDLFTVELQKVYRQKDYDFVTLLDNVRINSISKNDIEKINTRFLPEDKLKEEEFAITLTTINALADKVNNERLRELKTPPFSYFAEVSGEFEESKYPTDPELVLKIGAQVIFIKNDTERRWVNGAIGQVVELGDGVIKVKLENGIIHSVLKRVWENTKYQYDKKNKKIEQETIGTFKQYPLKLAWAITIHKSQGLTFDRVVVDFGKGTFASGQAYVALSRVTTFEGLLLRQKIHATDIYIDEEIIEFWKNFNQNELISEKYREGKDLFVAEKNSDNDKIGKYYFHRALRLIDIGQLKNAYAFLIKGYEYVVCDCRAGDWYNQDVLVRLLSSDEIDCKPFELDFIKSFLFFNSKEVNKALNSINSFIDLNPNNEIGYYLKGRIVEDKATKLECYNRALSLKETPRSLYRIGRETNNIELLYKASVIGFFSSHCLGNLIGCACQKSIKLKTNSDKLIANMFNELVLSDTSFRAEMEFISFIDSISNKEIIPLKKGRALTSIQALKKFKDTLIADEHFFLDSSSQKIENHQTQEVILEKKYNYSNDALPSGEKYIGEFKDGKYNGKGTLIFPNGSTYVGEFRNGQRNGFGTHTLPNGSKYVGEFKDGKINGTGALTFSNGEKYVGEFKDGKMNGTGALTSLPNGEKYVGEFKDGKINGRGRGALTSLGGEKYVGEFKDGKMNGRGT
ncbi:MAG: AAA family ATPase, partial [Trichodesmium erythraeum GBRTRLIN201]|nr:AAA family ATPase [Trichodesmium erythraeum GBRTRLIN201]